MPRAMTPRDAPLRGHLPSSPVPGPTGASRLIRALALRSSRWGGWLWVLALLATACTAAVAPAGAPVLPEFVPLRWLPDIRSVLARDSVATRDVALAPADAVPLKGDTLTILVQELDAGKPRQWAVVLSLQDLKPKERLMRSPGFTMYLNTGYSARFGPAPPTAVLIHVFGPYSPKRGGASPKAIWSGALVNPEFLRLGLERTAALFSRISHDSGSDPRLKGLHFTLSVSSNPFPRDQVARDRAATAALEITDAESRAYAGFIPAMMAFFQIVNQTPGMRELLFKILDVPWWQLVAHGGNISNVSFELLPPFDRLPPSGWGLPPDMNVYSLGLRVSVYGKPTLLCKLALTQPRVPLFNSAGIVGLAVMRPDGKGPRLMIRVMAGSAAHPLS